MDGWTIVMFTATFITLAVCVWRWLRRPNAARLRAQFIAHTARWHADWFAHAAATGKPRGLIWTACTWADDVLIDRVQHEWYALVAVEIAFAAVPGSDMEDLPALGNLRTATAVFVWHADAWRPTDKVVFNFGPAETLARLRGA
jgi:hypothetical protein